MAYLLIIFSLFSFPEFIRKGVKLMIKRGKEGGFATLHLFFLLAEYQSKCCFEEFLSLFYRAILCGTGCKCIWRSDFFFPVLWLEFTSCCIMFCFKCRTVLVIPLGIFVAFLSWSDLLLLNAQNLGWVAGAEKRWNFCFVLCFLVKQLLVHCTASCEAGQASGEYQEVGQCKRTEIGDWTNWFADWPNPSTLSLPCEIKILNCSVWMKNQFTQVINWIFTKQNWSLPLIVCPFVRAYWHGIHCSNGVSSSHLYVQQNGIPR